MGKLYDESTEKINSINSQIEEILELTTVFNNEYSDDYLLNNIKDASLLRKLLIDKIECGIKP